MGAFFIDERSLSSVTVQDYDDLDGDHILMMIIATIALATMIAMARMCVIT